MDKFRKCCKPYRDSKCSDNLRPVTNYVKQFMPQSVENQDKLSVCTTCYFNITCKRRKIEPELSPVAESSATSPITPQIADNDDSSDSEECYLKNLSVLEKMNEVLPVVGKSPIYLSTLEARPKHQRQKLIDLTSRTESTSLVSGIVPLFNQSTEDQRKIELYDELIGDLKTKFKELEKTSDKIQLLTILPKSLTIQEIQGEFKATQHMVRTAKDLRDKNGPLSRPAAKVGKRISDELKQAVLSYYTDDDVSRIMPGKNDCLTIDKVKVQKRLMMCTLKECYEGYKTVHQGDESKKIGFSKFSLLRPKYCVQPGSSGTHTVCVCTIHQNVKLIIYGTKMETITNGNIANYRDCVSSILCAEPTPSCYLLECESCPGLDNFKEYLKIAFLEHGCEDAELKFSQWVSTDRCNLETFSQPLDVFLDYFINKMKNLLPHCFISLQQSSFLKNKKLALKSTEVIVLCDFAENYAFIMQNAAQGFHWNNKQATIHPFVIYQNFEGKLHHHTFVIISDCLHHDTVAVHLFIEKLMQFLKTKISSLSKIYYITDGAVTHYKNKKNFKNILKHKEDFGVDCEWHFHATAHGKGPCDGVGGTIKRMASRASLTMEYGSTITNADELFKWAQTLKTDINFGFCSDAEHKSQENKLATRLQNLKTVNGTHGFHAVIPTEDGYLICKKYSNSDDYIKLKL